MSTGRLALIILVFLIPSADLQGFPDKTPPRKYKHLQKYIDRATHDKLSGVILYIHDKNFGEWTATSGYANIERKESLRTDYILSMGSVGKMYMAVAVLKLAEDGRLALEDRIEKYLPHDMINHLPGGKEVTVRHLLGHTSGFINYESDTTLNRLYLTGRLRLDTIAHVDMLKRYVYDRRAFCAPGAEYHYSSTNYMLLAMIVDNIVTEGHSSYLRTLIRRQGLVNTYYRQSPPKKNVHYYGDLNRDEVLEDVTNQTIETTNWFMGDDGVYAPIGEAAHFLQDLMNGKILNQQSLQAMTTWDNDKNPDYGLGLMADKSFPYGFLLGHSGRGIGVTTDLYYFPKQDRTVAIFCNTGLRAAAPGFRKAYNKMRAKIVKKLFLF